MAERPTQSPALGGCACGQVRFAMHGAPIIVHGCHCKFCQRMSGSAFAVNAMIEADRVQISSVGRPEIVPTPSELPAGQKVHRCPRCQLALWSNHSGLGDAIVLVNVGTLDHAEAFVPDVHCYTRSKHRWVVIPQDVPQFEVDYDSDAIWSDEAKRRLRDAE